jgi:hypothetical protein
MSDGWSHEKRVVTEQAFYEFLNRCNINSKDLGPICLGEGLYDGQIKFITTVFDALEEGIHKIYVLKSRQLGISTIARALTIFLIGIHDGLKGAVVFDTDANKQESRAELEVMINDLPPDLGFSAIKHNNRAGLTLVNDSKILFMTAGVRKTKNSGTLGRSVGLTIAHLSEICSYDNEEGLESFEQSLSEVHPDRLYIYESTARGFNRWWKMWLAASADPTHCKCLFLGWWSKPSQAIDTSDRDFAQYGMQAPTQIELKKIAEVAQKYGHKITPQQLAWIRRKMDPSTITKVEDESEEREYAGSITRVQEQPWTEEEAFQFSAATFFSPENLKDQVDKHVSKRYKSFYFGPGHEFTDIKVHVSQNPKHTELKVWEEPKPHGVYVLSADVAYGSSEKNDRSAFSVLRCYADGCDQVAEYAWPLIGTRQYAWAILAVAAWYAGTDGECYLIIELNGPGTAVWDEISHVRRHITSGGYQPKEIAERGLGNIFRNIRNFIYSRPDAMSPGKAWQWKTAPGVGPTGKVRLMERLRDFVSNDMLHIRSLDTCSEMQAVVREADTIESQGQDKDDRVVALALGVMCWQERVRRVLSAQQRTRESDRKMFSRTMDELSQSFQDYQFQNFLTIRKGQRDRVQSQAVRAGWRDGNHRRPLWR